MILILEVRYEASVLFGYGSEKVDSGVEVKIIYWSGHCVCVWSMVFLGVGI